MRGILHPFHLAIAVAAGGCGAAGDENATVIRDSAGIAIVEHAPGSPAPAWSLGEPALALGSAGADEAYELFQPLHALRLEDGRVVVANHGTEELRFFAPDGTHLRTVGRKGGGPGEFRDLWGLARLPGDSLAAWDWTARRLTIYDEHGEFARIVTPVGDFGFAPRLLGTLDRTFVVIPGFNPGAIFASGGGLRRDAAVLLRFDADDGALADSLGPHPTGERYVRMGDGQFWMAPVQLGQAEHIRVGPDGVVVGDDRTGEIRAHDAAGRLVRIIRAGEPGRPVTSAHLARYRERHLADADQDRLEENRRRLDETPAAQTLPAFTDLFVDRLGRFWVEHFDGDYDGPDRWTVLDPEGRPLGALELPPRMRPLDAGEDYLLAYWKDDLDVEHVRLHPIHTRESP